MVKCIYNETGGESRFTENFSEGNIFFQRNLVFRWKGIMTFPGGIKYVGEFRDGKRNGQGTMTLPDGTKYVGEFRDNAPYRQGTITFPDGRKYVGEFRNDSLLD